MASASHLRKWGNCCTFAFRLWLATRGRGWIGFRRSEGFSGLVPHFVHGRVRKNGLELLLIEAIPPRRKGAPWSRGDFVLAFPMIVRASLWKRTGIGTGDRVRDAVRDMRRSDICRHCGRMP